MADKPASKAIAKGLARGDRFVGQFALPGMVPDFVKQGGSPAFFATEREAHAAAAIALVATLTHRASTPNRTKEYERISGAHLALVLAEADVTPSAFARFYGVPRDRVLMWLSGEQEIPHSAHLLACLLSHDHVKSEVETMTDQALKEGRK